jgi:hypothetical protein
VGGNLGLEVLAVGARCDHPGRERGFDVFVRRRHEWNGGHRGRGLDLALLRGREDRTERGEECDGLGSNHPHENEDRDGREGQKDHRAERGKQ